MQDYEMPRNTLIHTFGMYNAIVVGSDGTRVQWNNTLGFSIAEDSATWPIVNISEMPDVLEAVEKFIQDSKGKSD